MLTIKQSFSWNTSPTLQQLSTNISLELHQPYTNHTNHTLTFHDHCATIAPPLHHRYTTTAPPLHNHSRRQGSRRQGSSRERHVNSVPNVRHWWTLTATWTGSRMSTTTAQRPTRITSCGPPKASGLVKRASTWFNWSKRSHLPPKHFPHRPWTANSRKNYLSRALKMMKMTKKKKKMRVERIINVSLGLSPESQCARSQEGSTEKRRRNYKGKNNNVLN